MRFAALLLVLAVAACSDAPAEATRPASCKRGDRAGTYYLQGTETSGTCGRFADGLATLSSGPPSAGCEINAERWSEGDCKLERDLTCIQGWLTTRTVAVTRDEIGDGSRLSGTVTITQDDCRSTYSVVATRQ